jgi:hypothetical protein
MTSKERQIELEIRIKEERRYLLQLQQELAEEQRKDSGQLRM